VDDSESEANPDVPLVALRDKVAPGLVGCWAVQEPQGDARDDEHCDLDTEDPQED
jgi:hypothetical protein